MPCLRKFGSTDYQWPQRCKQDRLKWVIVERVPNSIKLMVRLIEQRFFTVGYHGSRRMDYCLFSLFFLVLLLARWWLSVSWFYCSAVFIDLELFHKLQLFTCKSLIITSLVWFSIFSKKDRWVHFFWTASCHCIQQWSMTPFSVFTWQDGDIMINVMVKGLHTNGFCFNVKLNIGTIWIYFFNIVLSLIEKRISFKMCHYNGLAITMSFLCFNVYTVKNCLNL